MIVQANAKVNFTLEVLGVRADGYHDLRSVVVPVSLADTLEIIPSQNTSLTIKDDNGFLSKCNCEGENNLIIKAVRLMQQKFGKNDEVSIKLEKKIPCGGGLGGGSSDAAATIKALNKLWDINVPIEELIEIGAELGSDIPALILGGIVLMEGRGERVTPIKIEKPYSYSLILTNPGVFCSTPEIFKLFKEGLPSRGNILYNMISSIASGDFKLVASALNNDLAETAYLRYSEVAQAAKRLKEAGCEGVSMSGSGATVFGVVRDEAQAREIMERMASSNWIEFVHTCPVV
jgi:4-diphosphocytidyl-2-C-methyl-D-erythritol kinase